MADALKKYGKYFLLDQIAQGGMAEIYRARMATPDGGSRLLAIKKVIGNYSQNPEFVSMFKSEIKTTSGFTHPNIVQLYDYGEESGTLFIAMELVDGKNVRQFISRLAEAKQAFPVEVAVYIMEEAAKAMAYAHGFKDKITGKLMNIVHRDISPQNILISYEGDVKVIDFGIAKAQTNSESTRAGVIKGKPSYLSPEQISGEVLDGRSDIFALGIVLWELLTGKRLFVADNDFAVLKLIENSTTHVKPPSLYNPKIPKELDTIVLKCLHNDRDQRYQSSDEMQRALHKFLYQFYADFNPTDLAQYAKDLFKNEIVEDRKKLLSLNDKVEKLLIASPAALQPQASPKSADSTQAAPSAVKEDATLAISKEPIKRQKGTGSFRVVDLDVKKEDTKITLEGDQKSSFNSMTAKSNQSHGFTPAANGTKQTQRPQNTRTTNVKKDTSSRLSIPAAIFIMGLLGAGYWYYTTEIQREPASTAKPQVAGNGTIVIDGNIKAASVMLDDRPVANQLPAYLKGVPTGKPVKIVVTSNGYKKFSQEVQLADSESKTIQADLSPEAGTDAAVAANTASNAPPGANTSQPVTLKLNINPIGIGTSISINGAQVDASGITSVKTGVPLNLVVEREGFRTFRKTVTISAAELAGKTEYGLDVALEAAKFGFVSIKTTPSADAIVSIDGQEERWPTPISRKRIPVGNYKIKLINSLLGMEKEVEFTVSEDRFTNIDERLSVTPQQKDGRVPSGN